MNTPKMDDLCKIAKSDLRMAFPTKVLYPYRSAATKSCTWTKLDGIMMHWLFKSKPVYLRPYVKLLDNFMTT